MTGNPIARNPRGFVLGEMKKAVAERDRSECWPWTFTKRLNSGYASYYHEGKNRLVHHIALLLDGRDLPGPREESAHTCHGGKTMACWNPDHLVATSHLENVRMSVDEGRYRRGARPKIRNVNHYKVKLSPEVIEQCQRRVLAGERVPALAAELGVSRSTLGRALKAAGGWGDLITPIKLERRGGSKLTKEEVLAIRSRAAGGASRSSLAKEYGLSVAGVAKIVNRLSWADV